MKKKFLSVLLTLAMAMGLCVPVFAQTDFGYVYDETDTLVEHNEDSLYAAEELIPNLAYNYGFDLHVDVLTTIGDFEDMYEVSQYLYQEFGYGVGATSEGISITLLLEEDADGYVLADWGVYSGGEDELLDSDGIDAVYFAISADLEEDAWAGDADSDSFVLSSILNNAADALERFALENGYESTVTDVPDLPEDPQPEIALPAAGASGLLYINDSCGLLSADEADELEDKAQALMEEYAHPVYLLIVDDYNNYYDVTEPYEAAKEYYFANELGVGTEQDGTILLMSMDNRKMATMHKGYGNVVFTDYGDQYLRDEIKKDFADDEWVDGFNTYYDVCGELLELAAEGEPFDASNDDSGRVYGVIASIVLAIIIAFVVVAVLKGQLKSVAEKAEAGTYVIEGGIDMHNQYDRYTHTTQTRVYEEPPRDRDGGTSIDSDGCSGSSDDF